MAKTVETKLGKSKYSQGERYRVSFDFIRETYEFEVANWNSKWNPAWNLQCSYPLNEFSEFIKYVRERVSNLKEIINDPSKQSNTHCKSLQKRDFKILIKPFEVPSLPPIIF